LPVTASHSDTETIYERFIVITFCFFRGASAQVNDHSHPQQKPILSPATALAPPPYALVLRVAWAIAVSSRFYFCLAGPLMPLLLFRSLEKTRY
jgi:hypothetical protein